MPNYIIEAEKLYTFWYNLRVKYYAETITNLDSTNHATYCYKRLEEEAWGTPTNWQLFYNRVRDSSWPECQTEEEFKLLPVWIQQELVTVFGYQPQTLI